jgi:hypothetical protein
MYNTPVAFQKIHRVFGILLLILSLVALIWGLHAGKYLLQTTDLAPADMALPGLEQPTGSAALGAANPLAPEPHLLELSWPKSLRLGDDGTLRLTVGIPLLPPASSTGSQTPPAGTGGVQPGIYDAYNLVLQSHLDLPGITRTPTGEVSQALLPDQPVVFLWYLRPVTPGIFSGKVWLHLRFVPRSAGQEERILLAAQQIDIQVITLLGMSGSQARLFGSLGLVLGGFLGLDGVVNWGFEQLVKRKKGQKT